MEERERIIKWSAILFCLLLPLSTKLSNIALGIFVVSVLYVNYRDIKWSKNIFNFRGIIKILFCTTAVFILLLSFGLLYTDYFNIGIKYFENYSSYLLLPFVFSTLKVRQLKFIKIVSFPSFFYGCLISSIILLLHNFFNFFSVQDSFAVTAKLFGYDFTYHNFASLLKFHPSLLGFYIVFSLAIVLKKGILKIKWYTKLICCIVLLLCILFLNSRSSFLLTILVFSFYFIYYLFFSDINKMKMLSLFVFCLFLLVGISQSMKRTYVYDRLTNELEWELQENVGTKYNEKYVNDSRMARWKAIFKGAMEKPIFGNGSGSEMAVLQKIYHENGLKYASQLEYGSHNQYLTILVENGFLGVFLFLFYLIYNLGISIAKRNILFIYFFSAIFIACCFDSILYLNTSIIFVAFFSNLFIFSAWKEIPNTI